MNQNQTENIGNAQEEWIEVTDQVIPNTGIGSIKPLRAPLVMTGNRFPKSIMKALGLPGLVQEFHLHVKKHEIVEIECRYIPFVQDEERSE